MRRETQPGTDGIWTVIVPVKPLARAKTRLSPAAGGRLRPELALAFAQDTVCAALACASVRTVAVVTMDPLAAAELSVQGARVIPEPSPEGRAGHPAGLNTALAHGVATVRAEHQATAVAALNSDLPALRPGELARALTVAARFPRAFLPDTEETGTTLLTARPGVELTPEFGTASRSRHAASGAVPIEVCGVASVRRDVDTGADLDAALALGVGPRTAARCAALGLSTGGSAVAELG